MLQHANFILLDAAIMGAAIDDAQIRNPRHISLFKGRPEEDLTGVAPFLFRYAHNTDFANWFLTQGWGKAWGVLIKSTWPLPELQKHLQSLLRATSEDGQRFIFRYYDPRILRVFLPSCDSKQLREFFGENHIDYCIVEDEDPAFALRFRLENGILKTDRQAIAEIIASLPAPLPLVPLVAPAPAAEMDPALMAALRQQYPEPESEVPEAEQATPMIRPSSPAAEPHDTCEHMRATSLADSEQAGPKSRWNLFD